MAIPRVMLLSGSVPSAQDVGGIILRDLVNLYPPGRLCCFALNSEKRPAPEADPSWMPLRVETIPSIGGVAWDAGLLRRGTAHYRDRMARHRNIPRLIRAAVELGRKQDVNLVWAVLSHPWLYRIAPAVADTLGVPLVVTVWDPPESIALNLRLDHAARQIALRDFEQALRSARRAGVMSETMADEYQRRFGIETVILRHGVDSQQRRPVAACPQDDGTLTIGFSGSLYATEEWNALLSALTRVHWRVAERDVRIRALTPSLAGVLRGPGHIEWLGWRPTHEAIGLLAECDVNYLPYWFDPARREAVRLCFPTKLTTYLAAGRPVFFHGPQDSSPVKFFERFPLAECCHSLAEADILASLERVATDADFRVRASVAVAAAIDEELNMATFRARFADLLGVERHALTPLLDYTALEASLANLTRLVEAAAT